MKYLFETERLAVRSWTLDDAHAAFRLWGDAEVMQYVGDGTPQPDVEASRRNLKWAIDYEAKHRFCRWAVVEKDSGDVIGSCGFMFQNGETDIDLGYYFARPYWDRGYATEVAAACLEYGARTLCLKTISATVDVRHIASQRVLEKLGFTYRKTVENDDGTTDKYYVIRLDR